MKEFINKNWKVLSILFVGLVFYLFVFNKQENFNNHIKLYGTEWCGFTTKQKKNLDEVYGVGNYNYIDCDADNAPDECKNYDGWPVTIIDGVEHKGYKEFSK